jgi:hypothetical protein
VTICTTHGCFCFCIVITAVAYNRELSHYPTAVPELKRIAGESEVIDG